MSSGYGPNSKASATSDAYRNNPIWDKKKTEAASNPEPLTQDLSKFSYDNLLQFAKDSQANNEYQQSAIDKYKQLLQAALESLPVDSITYVAIELALREE